MNDVEHEALIRGLLQPQAYDHPVEAIRVQETHISWILLTGSFAYKMKKPVKLDFVDFSTLARRRFFCHEEIRLNRRLAPQLYLGVVPIAVVDGNSRMDCEENPVEYAVKMRQFSQGSLLSVAIEQGRLRAEQIDQLAEEVARFHQRIEVADRHQSFGLPGQVFQPMRANFQELFQASLSPDRVEQLQWLSQWSSRVFHECEQEILSRKERGFVRECHGDMHLGNMILDDGTVTIFDCIEFNEEFRWIDVLNEVAFCFMDLLDWKRKDLAYRFLNAYLQFTGDYSGLMVIPFYAVYRALVRAKVDWIRLRQEFDASSPKESPSGSQSATESRTGVASAASQSAESRKYAEVDPALFDQLHGYLDLAQACAQSRRCYVVITHGVSGSGKTYTSQTLLESLGAIRIRTDVERKRIFGIDGIHSSRSAVGAEMYSPSATAETYERLVSQAAMVLEAGFPVILDGTFLRREQRMLARQLAQQRGVPFRILHVQANVETLRRRILQRMQTQNDASEADLEVLQDQQANQEPLNATERQWTVEIDSEVMGADELIRRMMDTLGLHQI